ncbi:hypothetical protein ACWJJH_19265 [Endozoicomonadaceae bacterium StTr2]
MWGELHESKEIVIKLPQEIPAGLGNRLLRELGATLYYDVYSFDSPTNKIWQSDSILDVELFSKEKEVDAQDNFDEIRLTYLFASRPSSDQKKALGIAQDVITTFKGIATYNGQSFSKESVQTDWDSCTDYLLKEWGEEPGSESLAVMIHENYT